MRKNNGWIKFWNQSKYYPTMNIIYKLAFNRINFSNQVVLDIHEDNNFKIDIKVKSFIPE
jgi:hypothetical protein